MIDKISAIAAGFTHIGWTFYQWRCGALRWKAVISDNPIGFSPWQLRRTVEVAFRRRKLELSQKEHFTLLEQKYQYCWEQLNGKWY